MTANTTVDILKYTAAATPKTGGAKSFADKSGNFTSILDTANKSYAAGDSSSHSSNNLSTNTTNTNKINTQNTNSTINKTVNNNNNKTTTDNSNKANNTQNDSQTDSSKNSTVQNQTDNSSIDSTKTATSAQEPITGDAKDTEKTLASAEAKTDAAAADDAAENEKAASDLKTAIDENAADKAKANDAINTKISANAKDEKTIADKNAIADAEADACAKQNQVTDANTTALETAATANEADTKITNKSDSIDKTDKNKKADDVDDAEKNTESSAKTDINAQPAIDLTTLNLSKAVENIIVSLPQAVKTDNDNTPVNNDASNIQSVQSSDKSAQEDLKININNQLNQITSPKDITAKELNNVNIPSKIQLGSQQETVTEPSVKQASTQPTEASDAQNTNVDSPAIKVNTEAVTSDINLNSHLKDTNEKQTTKSTLNAQITQEIIDKTNAKITSVQSENSSDSSSNNLLNKQHAGEEAIKFAIENNSNDKENKQNITQAIGASTQDVELTSITANTTSQPQQNTSVNFAKTLEGVQTPVETPKELNKSDILSQINNKLSDLKDEGTTKINIILRPENLGKLNLELVTSKEGLTAQITADSAHVKELLDKNLDSLKDTLGSQGVNVNNVSVKVVESPKQDSTNYFEQQSQQQNNQQQSNNKQSNGQGFAFRDESNKFADMSETNSTETEDLSSSSTDPNKVDYKV